MCCDPPPWVQLLSEEAIKRDFSIASWMRGRVYAASGHVLDHNFTESNQVTATVRGSGLKVYRTSVQMIDGTLVAKCSCVLVSGCKHAVAVLLSALEATQGHAPSWEQALAPLMPAGGARDREPLRFALQISCSAREVTELLLRPLRDSSKGWVSFPGGWAELASVHSGGNLDPRQAAAMRQLAVAAGITPGYGHFPQLRLADLGAMMWPLLRRCESVGIPLLPGEHLQQVTLGTEPVRLWLDATASAEGIKVCLSGDLGSKPEGGIRFLLGSPAHGIAQLVAGALHLAQLAEAVPEGLHAMVREDPVITIPEPDVGRFRATYLTALSREGLVVSSDGSCPMPELSRPQLVLGLASEPPQRLSLSWRVRYGQGPAAVELQLFAATRYQLGDQHCETQQEQQVLELLEEYPELVDPKTGRLLATGELEGIRAARFVTDVVHQLAELGVSVEPVGELSGFHFRQEAPQITLLAEERHRQDWFNLRVRVSVAGVEVEFEQLFLALALGQEAMPLGDGTWFSLDHPELARLRQLIAEARELAEPSPNTQAKISLYQAGLWEELASLGVVDPAARSWQRRLSRLLELPQPDQVAPPAGLVATLRPYQAEGFAWLARLWDAGLGGVLADDMGLGKTLQTLALVERARERGELAPAPVLVVAPASVVSTWAEEAARFTPGMRVAAIQAGEKRRGNNLAAAVSGAHLVVTSYALFRYEAPQYRQLPWRGLILDEAQFVKNPRARTHQLLKDIRAGFTLAITGTPLENSLKDLWAITNLVAPGLLPRLEVFTERYLGPIEDRGQEETLAQLRRRLRPFMLRRNKSQVAAELPDKVEQIRHLELAPEHRRSYDRYLSRERARVLGMLDDLESNRIAIFRALTRLRLLALDPRLVDDEAPDTDSVKIMVLVAQLRELAEEGHKALVFSSFTKYLDLVRRALEAAGINYVYLYGRTRNRAERIAEFREGDAPVFLISLKAGGFGLTLTEAEYVFVMDPWWNPAAESQAVDRAHRIGQTKAVNVYRLVSSDTIEENVVALQQRKRALFDSVLEAGQFHRGILSAADIRNLLS